LYLTNVLALLRQGRVKEAEKISGSFANGSKELLAEKFLIGPQPLKEKETEFRRRLGEKQAGFADFIIGEHHLKDGNKEQALNAYRNSFQTLQKMRANNQSVETWLINLVEARLYELTGAEGKPEDISMSPP
jgi:hypothetical protein